MADKLLKWEYYKVDEGRGFVSGRLFPRVCVLHYLSYGTCIYQNYAGIKRVISPKDFYPSQQETNA